MPVVQPKPGPESVSKRTDEKLMAPGKYEVSPEDVFTIDLYLKQEGRRWILSGQDKNSCHETVTFRMWTYDEMVEMRKLATNFDPMKRIHLVDQDALNRMKVQRLVTGWTLDKDNPRLRIQHANGVLTDESWTAFSRLHPSISTFIIDSMNFVLEYRG